MRVQNDVRCLGKVEGLVCRSKLLTVIFASQVKIDPIDNIVVVRLRGVTLHALHGCFCFTVLYKCDEWATTGAGIDGVCPSLEHDTGRQRVSPRHNYRRFRKGVSATR